MSIISYVRGRRETAPQAQSPAAAACWVCSGGNGPMCAGCSRRVRDTATREARTGYLAAGGHS